MLVYKKREIGRHQRKLNHCTVGKYLVAEVSPQGNKKEGIFRMERHKSGERKETESCVPFFSPLPTISYTSRSQQNLVFPRLSNPTQHALYKGVWGCVGLRAIQVGAERGQRLEYVISSLCLHESSQSFVAFCPITLGLP